MNMAAGLQKEYSRHNNSQPEWRSKAKREASSNYTLKVNTKQYGFVYINMAFGDGVLTLRLFILKEPPVDPNARMVITAT